MLDMYLNLLKKECLFHFLLDFLRGAGADLLKLSGRMEPNMLDEIPCPYKNWALNKLPLLFFCVGVLPPPPEPNGGMGNPVVGMIGGGIYGGGGVFVSGGII